MMIRPNSRSIRPKRPNNFCYHCNQNFPTKDELKLHVQNISRRSNRAPDFNIVQHDNYTEQRVLVQPSPQSAPPQQSSHRAEPYTLNQNRNLKRRQSLKLICDHCDCIFSTMEQLQSHTASLMREKHHDDQMTSASMEDEEDHELKNYAPSGTGTVGTVKVECDFFELNEDEFNQIKNSAMPEFASFTLDGKECYHCGEEFSSTTAMHQHPSICTRMKNATNLGKVMKIDGTVEEINGVKIHPVPSRPLPNKSRPSTSGSTKARRVPVEKMYMKRESSADMHHRQKPVDLSCRVLQPDSSDNLVIAQEDDDIEGNVDVMHDTGSPDDRIVEMEQPNNDQRYESNLENNQPIDEGHDHVQHYDNRVHDNGYNNHSRSHNGVKCNLCGQMLRDRMTLRIHKLQCTKNYQLPVRKSGHSGSVVLSGRSTVKGHCCYHCDRMFPSKDELRNHVAEISKMNLAEY